MHNFNDIAKTFKQISLSANENAKPAGIFYGTVQRANPVQVNVEQKLVLDKDFLIITERFKNTTVTINVEGKNYSYTINNELKTGDKVILLREQGGQKFLILDRVK